MKSGEMRIVRAIALAAAWLPAACWLNQGPIQRSHAADLKAEPKAEPRALKLASNDVTAGSELTEGTYKEWRRRIAPSTQERAWKEIAWRPVVWNAVQEAQ